MEVSGAIRRRGRIRANVLQRPRLLALLDGGHDLVVIRAPKGYGKSTLLYSWLSQASGPTISVAIETENNFGAAFVRFLIVHNRSALGLSPDAVDLVRQRLERGEDPWTTLDECLSEIEDDFCLAIDNFSDAETGTQRQIVKLFHRHPNMRLLVTEDILSVVDEPELELRTARLTIDATELCLTNAEVSDHGAGLELTAGEIMELTGGMPALVQALALSGSVDHRGGSRFDTVTSMLHSYFGFDSMTSADDDPHLSILVRSSIADSLTRNQVNFLCDAPDADAALDVAVQAGLGRWDENSEEPTFTFTGIFRMLLRRKLDEIFALDRPVLLARLATWSSNNDQPITAVVCSIKSGDIALTQRVVMQHFFSLLHIPPKEFLNHLSSLPVATMMDYPALCFFAAVIDSRMPARHSRGIRLFEATITAARRQLQDADPTFTVWLFTMEAMSCRIRHYPEAAFTAARNGLQAIERLTPAERDALAYILPASYTQIALALYNHGRVDEALMLLRSGIAEGEAHHQVSSFDPLSLTAGISAMEGDVQSARGHIESILSARWPREWRDGQVGEFYRFAECVSALESFDLPRAQHHLEALHADRSTLEHRSVLAALQGWVDLLHGRPEAGLGRLELEVRVRESTDDEQGIRGERMAPARALLLLAAGRPADASDVLEAVSTSHAGHIMVQIARVSLFTNQPSMTLRRLASIPAGTESLRTQAERLVLETCVALRIGNRARAAILWSQVEHLLTATGMRMPLVLVPNTDLTELQRLAGEASPGTRLFDGMPMALFNGNARIPQLTPREVVVLTEATRSDSVATIASRLFVSPNTVKAQFRSIFRKLEVSSREDAVAVAASLRLIEIDGE